MAGKFEVYQDRAGKYRFRLNASNGQVVATREAYEKGRGEEGLRVGPNAPPTARPSKKATPEQGQERM